jgi:hypothetical protein
MMDERNDFNRRSVELLTRLKNQDYKGMQIRKELI